MRQFNQTIHDTESLEAFLKTPSLALASSQASAVLVQVFSAKSDPAWLGLVGGIVERLVPGAVVVGASTMGEILDGRTLTGHTVVCVSCFEGAALTPLVFACEPGQESEVGRRLAAQVAQVREPRAVLMLCTLLSVDASRLLTSMAEHVCEVPMFGGGAGNYESGGVSIVLAGGQCLDSGGVGVVMAGRELHVEVRACLGWHALSRKMTVTAADGLRVDRVDGHPAFEVYRHYLGIADDERFFLNVLEYPFLIERDGEVVARTPMAVDRRGALTFAADIAEGEEIRIGYGDPGMIAHEASGLRCALESFGPEGVFVYSCISRRFLIEGAVDSAIQPFEKLGPTAGFYTTGEIFGHAGRLRLLNSTMVVVGLREGGSATGGAQEVGAAQACSSAAPDRGLVAEGQAPVVSRLLHFIGAVVEELERSNRELELLCVTDKLTQVYNRAKLDAAYTSECQRSARHRIPFAVVMLDIDNFKRVNDTFGHQAGDQVLIELSGLIKRRVRKTDIFGRWGGEEFLIILPFTAGGEGSQLAEEIRAAVAAHVFPEVGHVTACFGIAVWDPADVENSLLMRADAALYLAKQAGRNRVILK